MPDWVLVPLGFAVGFMLAEWLPLWIAILLAVPVGIFLGRLWIWSYDSASD